MSTDRFLLIKAWSSVLCADIDHVLSQLLIAEMTDRIPVVFWPTHCLHNGFIQTNGFELYFESISNDSIFNLVKPEYTYYPPIWDPDNLLVEDQTKDTWTFRNIGVLLASNANVVVGDVYYNIYELIPFIKKSHPAYGMTVEDAYRYIFNKYIRIKPDIDVEIQGFYNSWIRDCHPALAVHVRRVDESLIFTTREADKFENQYWNKFYIKYKRKHRKKKDEKVKSYRLLKKGRYKEPNKAYHKEIKQLVDKYNVKKIFLLTDCEETLKEYKAKYGSMLVYTDCKRLSAEDEVSLLENPMIKRRRGIEVLKDAYVASKCDYFIGNDFSHLSHTIARIKDWPDKCIKLLYWRYKKRKYPINTKLILKDRNNIFSRLARKVKNFIGKHLNKPLDGGETDAK